MFLSDSITRHSVPLNSRCKRYHRVPPVTPYTSTDAAWSTCGSCSCIIGGALLYDLIVLSCSHSQRVALTFLRGQSSSLEYRSLLDSIYNGCSTKILFNEVLEELW